MNKSSSIEVSEVPEWLVQLEKRREKLTKGKLGHESGAGAPCNACGKSCPGLDLHFWRKVCRNCKCRKEQHNCPDDDLTGWAQFEILGQTRSQSAYINISQFAEKPIKLDWVPPNVDPDLVSDYMTQLGSTHIPITGSEAATKRKQQLEYQVPLHDLDATLCHNLSENEQTQLQQYVEKLKDNCVGQGMVTRIMPSITAPKIDGNYREKASNFVSGENTNNADDDTNSEQRLLLNQRDLAILKQLGYERDAITLNMCTDPIVKYLLNSESIEHLLSPAMYAGPFTKTLSSKPLNPDFMTTPYLSDTNKIKLKLMKIDTKTIKAGVMNGPFYDKMFNRLDTMKSNYANDAILMPLKEFRKEYLKNDSFKKDLNNFVQSITGDNNTDDKRYNLSGGSLNENLNALSLNSNTHQTPVKHGKQSNRVGDTGNDSAINEFHSPIPVKAAWTVNEDGGRLLNQETPMRKIQFNKNLPTSSAPTTTTLPQNDQFLARIYNSNAIQNALNDDDRNYGNDNRDIILTDVPMKCDFDNCSKTISDDNHKKLQNMNVNTMAICSSVISGPIYDKLFQDLDEKNYNIQKCGILQPIRQFRKEYTRNPSFRNDIQCSDILAYADLLNVIEGANDDDDDDGEDDNQKTSVGNNKKNVIATSVVPVPVFKCKHCQSDIMSGEVAVKAERAGKGIVWHPKCFVCHCCGELLVDLVYFYHNGNVYCGRDLANILNIPRCQACDELIFTKEYTAAEDSTFHIKHFCCYQCDIPLAGKRYVPDDKVNQPLCLPCFDQFHAARCERCLLMIRPDEQGVSYGKLHWHGTCFMCFGVDCGKSLIGGKFCFKKNLVFCSPDCVASVQQ